MRQTLREIGYHLIKVSLLCDNESAICLADNPIEHSYTKHIDIQHHFLRDQRERGDINVCHISTDRQLADIFTKPLDEKRFRKLRSELNILDSCNLDWSITYMSFHIFDHVILSLIIVIVYFGAQVVECPRISQVLVQMMHIFRGDDML
jgi:hypothetical protein